MKEFLAAFDALPEGAFTGMYEDRRYEVARTSFAEGRSEKLVAHEAGGTDYISLNLYRLGNGKVLLRPCEMSEEKVMSFVLSLEVGRFRTRRPR